MKPYISFMNKFLKDIAKLHSEDKGIQEDV